MTSAPSQVRPISQAGCLQAEGNAAPEHDDVAWNCTSAIHSRWQSYRVSVFQIHDLIGPCVLSDSRGRMYLGNFAGNWALQTINGPDTGTGAHS